MTSRGATKKAIEQTLSRLSYSSNLAEALKDADLVSESVPEDVAIKKSFYQELAKVAPKKTIFLPLCRVIIRLIQAVPKSFWHCTLLMEYGILMLEK